jgi:diguanylate cyclase (GGDEF)-like protein
LAAQNSPNAGARPKAGDRLGRYSEQIRTSWGEELIRAQPTRPAGTPAVDADERRLSGVVSGVLYAAGGVTLPSFLVLPGVTHAHWAALVAISSACLLWGLCSILAVDWNRAPIWLTHVSTGVGVALIAAAIASSGAAGSPAWVYLFFVVVYASYFYALPVAVGYLLGCVAIDAAPLLYDPRALDGAFLGQLAVAAPAYMVLGGAIIAGKRLMLATRRCAEALAAEQGALQRVATAVVGGEPADRVYALAARELAALLRCGAAGILRFNDRNHMTVLGSWADHFGGRYEPGSVVPIRPGSDVERARDTGAPVRIDEHMAHSPVRRLGYSTSIVAPLNVAAKPWGVLSVTAAFPGRFTAQDEARLMAFGDLLTTAIASIEDRAKLAAQASTDPLTGIANHRALQERLAAEVARALRHDIPVSVAVLDVDHFKEVNDNGGHEAGDEVLVRIAACLRKLARVEDTLGRVGGDEFAWVLPETTREQALVAVERARRVIGEVIAQPFRITVSAGICDTTVTADPADLIRLADGALYWSKAHGRDQCWIYDPEVVAELSAQERAERLERSHALLGLRALARAIDAKDPATSEHSERVSELVGKLARVAEWAPDRARLLSEAALVHDVGKIGIPDAVLLKTEPLTAAERLQITEHAELSARIVEDVLAPEQVEWIRTHHERPDGDGYPDGLTHEEISEGAALLAVADAWDVMTASRPYSVPKTIDEAIAECVELVGIQFTQRAVDAVLALHGTGELYSDAPGQPPAGEPSPVTR